MAATFLPSTLKASPLYFKKNYTLLYRLNELPKEYISTTDRLLLFPKNENGTVLHSCNSLHFVGLQQCNTAKIRVLENTNNVLT